MNPFVSLLLGFLVGAVIGGFIGWLLASRQQAPNPLDHRLEMELRGQLTQHSDEAAQLRQQLQESVTARAGAEAKCGAAERLLEQQQQLHKHTLAEANQAHEKALGELREVFKAISADALRQTQPEFLRLANETLGKFHESARGDLAARQQAIATVVKPLEEQLRIYQQRLQQSDSTQSTVLGEVKKYLDSLALQSQSLSNETLMLRRILNSNQARGRWGEETLRRVVEAAGMSPHCDFSEQTQAGDAKPDLLVRLPGERLIIVDSKVPDLDFLNALDISDGAKRAEALAMHAAKLKATVKALAERDYPSQFPNALDYVVLFLPAESLFSAALEGDPDLIVWAASKQILLAAPSSLIALLRGLSVSWQQHAQTENSRAIAEAAQELYNRVCVFADHLERIRSGLQKANDAFNDSVGSYERSVRPSGERLLNLGGGARTGKELPALPPLQENLRLPAGSSSSAATSDVKPDGNSH